MAASPNPSLLTSFDAPHTAREPSGFFGGLFSSTTAAAPRGAPPPGPNWRASGSKDDASSVVDAVSVRSRSASTIAPPSQGAQLEDTARTLKTVLKRLGSLGKATENDHKQFWMPDNMCKECYDCNKPFNTLRRRHHCRVCGQIFCWKCCSDVISGTLVGQAGAQRCCSYCARVSRDYISHAQQEVNPPPPTPESFSGGTVLGHRSSDGADRVVPAIVGVSGVSASASYFALPSRAIDVLQNADTEKHVTTTLRRAIAAGALELKDHRDRLVTYNDCFVASEFVSWLMAQKYVRKRIQAIALGQALLDAHYIVHVRGEEMVFKDEYSLFCVTEALFKMDHDADGAKKMEHADDDDNPTWFRQITNPADTAVVRASDHAPAVGDDLASSSPSLRPPGTMSPPLHFTSPDPSYSGASLPPRHRLGRDLGTVAFLSKKPVRESLLSAIPARQAASEDSGAQVQSSAAAAVCVDAHLRRVIGQGLGRVGLDAGVWTNTIAALLQQVVAHVQPNVRRGDKMDIRNYIKVKKGPGGSINQCMFHSGLTFSKNIAHKKMRSMIKFPRILILGFALDYQRIQNKMLSFDALLSQEQGYLQKLVAKIAALKPDVVIVEKAVSRLAQDFLFEAGITVMLNVKPSVVAALARCTQADVIASIEKLNFDPRLGTCETFQIRPLHLDGDVKQLAWFEGCLPERACTILLRGAGREELAKVKQVLYFCAYAAYTLRLEVNFLLNEHASLAASHLLPDAAPSNANIGSDITPLPSKSVVDAVLSPPRASVGGDRECYSATQASFYDRFSDALDTVVLSASPFVKYEPPFLLKPENQNCNLRVFLPRILYASTRFQAAPLPAPDCLAPRAHQSLHVLHAMWTPGNASCLNSHVLKMDFYGSNDVTLGNFLEHYCFPSTYSCPLTTCEVPMERHIRSFTHTRGRLLVGLERLRVPLPNPRPTETDTMVMWSWCKLCSSVTPIVPMEAETWALSFAKFLELTFCGTPMLPHSVACSHAIHQHHVRYFGKGTHTVYLDYEPITIFEAAIPPRRILPALPQISATEWAGIVANVKAMLHQTFDAVLERLVSVQLPPDVESQEKLAGLLNDLQVRRADDMQHGSTLHSELGAKLAHAAHCQAVPPSGPKDEYHVDEAPPLVFKDLIALEDSQRLQQLLVDWNRWLVNTIAAWNSTIVDSLGPYYTVRRPKRGTALVTPASSATQSPAAAFEAPLSSESPQRHSRQWSVDLDRTSVSEPAGARDMGGVASSHRLRMPSESEPGACSMEGDGVVDPCIDNSRPARGRSSISVRSVGIAGDDDDSVGDQNECVDPVVFPEDGSESLFNGDRNVVLAPEIVLVDAATVAAPSLVDAGISLAPSAASVGEGGVGAAGSPPAVATLAADDLPARDKAAGVIRTLTQMLPGGAGGVQKPLTIPFPATEHHQLPRGLMTVCVFEDEPSSIIAYTMAQPAYTEFLTVLDTVGGASAAGGAHDLLGASILGGDDVDENGLSGRILLGSRELSKAHFKYQFADKTTKFFCQIFFAKEFKDLRTELKLREKDFLISLSRCVKWDPHGGKSRSEFCKMADHRFILKQLSRAEASSVVDFVPHYIANVKEGLRTNKPSVLSRILGVFRIGFRNQHTGRAWKQDVLVMENLFYSHNIGRIFDLKGSMRSRYAQTTGKQNDVLLDENLLEFICDSPFFVRDYSKHVLETALYNDTAFLAQNDVMDYSLLVGIDMDSKELVVGIIDYVRTFTWDKRLEMYVKSSGILGGSGNLPTVVSPKAYRIRFLEAMGHYFHIVPDQWTFSSTFMGGDSLRAGHGGEPAASGPSITVPPVAVTAATHAADSTDAQQ